MGAHHCIYYNGMRGDEPLCERGIDVRALFKPLWPCFTGNDQTRASGTCEHFEAPTAEQLLAQEKRGDEAVERMFTAIVSIEQWEKTQPKTLPLRGSIECPCCKKRLSILVDTHHLYAQCETPECVNFRGNRRGCRR